LDDKFPRQFSPKKTYNRKTEHLYGLLDNLKFMVCGMSQNHRPGRAENTQKCL